LIDAIPSEETMSTNIETETKNVDSEPTTGGVPSSGPDNGRAADGTQSATLIRSATGPRTSQGKERSKRNALKHGVFSKQVVLPGESGTEFRALLGGLRDYFQPEGTPEDMLVEKLAVQFWRHRRSLLAERAEIQRMSQFVGWDAQQRQREHANASEAIAPHGGGILRLANNPILLESSLELLKRLRSNIQEHGCDYERDSDILGMLYGSDPYRSANTVLDVYSRFHTAVISEPVPEKKRSTLPEKCKQSVLEMIEQVMERLSRHQTVQEQNESKRMKLKALSYYVPDELQLDRLLRYETTISREIDRTLIQLERLQRMRRGQPVPPPINVNVAPS
jgi:hypothetical protein